MRYSPIINKRFLDPDLSDRVFHKQFTNGSEMIFTYASDDADRLRGPSTDRNLWDEVQDILFDPVITVGNETLSQSDYQFETYAGTPKTMENTIQYLWEISSQTEWVMPCSACNVQQYIDNEKVMGKTGPICVKCGANLNPFLGRWIDLNPASPGEDKESKLKGFHFNQVIMPMNVPAAMQPWGEEAVQIAQRRWNRILRKLENPISSFRNEVLGVSDAIGTRMLSKEELYALCTARKGSNPPNKETLRGISFTIGGVDWSGGGTTGVSRTVLWIWGFDPASQKLVQLFYKIYPGINPVHIIDEISTICGQYHVQIVVGDAGEGHTANNLLRAKLGYHRVHQLQYGSQKEALKWNTVDRFMADRTTLIDNYFLLLKNKGVELLNVDESKIAIEDILNEYEEITTAGKKVWRHSPQKPDDCLHAGLLGWIAFKITQNDLKFYQ
jgi:hypothetical protein